MISIGATKKRLFEHRWVIGVSAVFSLGLILAGLISWPVGLFGFITISCAVFLPQPAVHSEATSKNSDTIGQTMQSSETQSMFDGVPDPIALIGDDGRVILLNTAFQKKFGNITNNNSFMFRFRNPELQAAVRLALGGTSVAPVEFVESGTDELWFSVSIQNVSGPNQSGKVVVHFRDLTEVKRVEKVRSDFIANASHELRTPLASLSGFIETLAGPAKNDEAARDRFLKIMQEQAERMSRLIDDLLALSRFETARGRADFKAVDIIDVVQHVADALRPMAKSKGTEVLLETDGEIGTVFGSRDQLIQLFENLVENGIKYGNENGHVNITISNDAIAQTIIVEVRDDGPGIEKSHLPRLVERFYRVNVEASRVKQGTGLGLSIVRHIVQRHNGRLKISSEIDKGSSFVVILPIFQA